MVCTSRMLITDVVAKWPGSVNDARIFEESGLHTIMETGMKNVTLVRDCYVYTGERFK